MIYGEDNTTEIKCHIDKRVCITSQCSAWIHIPNVYNSVYELRKALEGKDLKKEQLNELGELAISYLNKGYCGLIIRTRSDKLASKNKEAFNLKVYQMECDNSMKRVKDTLQAYKTNCGK